MLSRLRAATPTWLESGRLLHLDKQFLSFLSTPAKSWLMLHLARFILGCVGTAEICCWRRNKPDGWNTSALSLPWSEVLLQLETIFIAQQSAVQIIQQVCPWGICSWNDVQASCIGGALWLLGRGAKEVHKEGLRGAVFMYTRGSTLAVLVAILARTFGPHHIHPV